MTASDEVDLTAALTFPVDPVGPFAWMLGTRLRPADARQHRNPIPGPASCAGVAELKPGWRERPRAARFDADDGDAAAGSDEDCHGPNCRVQQHRGRASV